MLVVDDDSLFRKMLSEILLRAGLAVETAVDGEVALRLIRSGRSYDLIVSDIEMPNVDGIELVGEVGRMPGGTKVVLVTGSTIDFVPGAEALNLMRYGPTGMDFSTRAVNERGKTGVAYMPGRVFRSSDIRFI